MGGTVYHVLNRANGRLRIFRKAADFLAFETILADGIGRFSMRLCGYCLMGNHRHLPLWPRGDGDRDELKVPGTNGTAMCSGIPGHRHSNVPGRE